MPPVLPTQSELEILQLIWQRGPSTVREIYKAMSADREIGYSTVLKFMQIMAEKGTLVRDESVRPQVYRPARPRRETQRRIVRDLVTRAFGGSSASLAMQALADRTPTSEELAEIRALVDRLERKGR